MADIRRQTGDEGERLVAEWLSRHGHVILERNWRFSHLEIDIISLDEEGIHFVEVKTRRPPMQADPQESVTLPKQRRIAKAAGAYLARSKDPRAVGVECHFDVAAVVIEKGTGVSINWFPDAFVPMYV